MQEESDKTEKARLKAKLFHSALQALQQKGWRVERIAGVGKASVRRITRGDESKVVSIRTTQDQWIAFPRNTDDTAWVTLSDVDAVVAVSVDDPHHPRVARVHLIDGKEMRDRFDRSYAARRAAGYQLPIGRGVWLSLYDDETTSPPTLVGAGAGVANPPIAEVPLAPGEATAAGPKAGESSGLTMADAQPLTIAEAKRRLAIALGVDPSNIKITVEA